MTMQHATANETAWEGPAKVRDLMTAKLTVIGPDETLDFALELMLWSAVHHLPVVRDGRLVGLLSDRDLLSRDIPSGMGGLKSTLVKQVMSTEVRTAAPDDDVSEAAARMAAAAINCLPVIEQGRLVGILTSTDILAERGQLLFKAGRGSVPCARTLMTTPVATVRADADLLDAVTQMLKHGVRHLPALDERGRIVGMVSERDLRGALGCPVLSLRLGSGGHAKAGGVASVMTAPPVVVHADATLFEIARHFIHDRFGAVPVVDDREQLIGIISYVDVLGYLLGDTQRSA
jgi:CBS domain-containing protein